MLFQPTPSKITYTLVFLRCFLRRGLFMCMVYLTFLSIFQPKRSDACHISIRPRTQTTLTNEGRIGRVCKVSVLLLLHIAYHVFSKLTANNSSARGSRASVQTSKSFLLRLCMVPNAGVPNIIYFICFLKIQPVFIWIFSHANITIPYKWCSRIHEIGGISIWRSRYSYSPPSSSQNEFHTNLGGVSIL